MSSAVAHLALRARVALTLGAIAFLSLWSSACDGPQEFRGVYEESLPLEEGRAWAIRLTLFEFADEVGGFVGWYRVDGERNTLSQPYFVREACVPFGPGPVRGTGFLIEARSADGGLFRARLREDGSASRLLAEVTEAGGLWLEPQNAEDARLSLDRVNVRATWEECAPSTLSEETP